MPPRAPTPDLHTTSSVSGEEDNAKMLLSSSSSSSTKKAAIGCSATGHTRSVALNTFQKKPTFFKNTFHWELNIYSFAVLGLLYYYTAVVPSSALASAFPACRMVWNVAFGLIAMDAVRYYYLRGNMAGVPYTLPFVTIVAVIVHPHRFWAEMADICQLSGNDGMCSNTLVGNHMVFVTDPKKCREVMTGEGVYGMYAHPNALWLFGPKNLIYLEQERHKKFRSILSPALFSKEALAQYAQAQERVVRKHLAEIASECAETGKPFDAQAGFRRMAAVSSQESFLGPYLDESMRESLEADILTFTMGFLCFPFPYFGSGLHTAIQAKHRIEKVIRDIVPKARAYVMTPGNEPRCMMEHWSVSILNAAKELGLENPQDVDCCNDDDMARTVLDFLFAAQDATNSALTYGLDIMDAHRDVLEKMRNEVDKALSPSSQKKNTIHDKKDSLEYIGKVANQLLHHKPPVPMVPHITKKACTLGGHAIGKGAVVIPSITYSARVSGASLEFLPEREDDDHMFLKTITFGAGQHKCPGRRYAESLLSIFLAVVASEYDLARVGCRSTADEFFYFPTIFPDDCKFLILPRKIEI